MTKLHFISIIILIASNLQAQNWLPDDASWYYNQVIFGFGNSYQHFEVIGETTFHGKDCKIITGLCQCSKYEDINYLYQNGDKIFIYATSVDSFRLLYDFGLIAGDTITVKGDEEGDSHFLIDSITNFQIGTLSLRTQNIHMLDGIHQLGNKIYEFIGAEGCLFPVIAICDPGTAGLRCYEDSEIGLQNFQIPEVPCDYVSNVKELETNVKVKIYPNPTEWYLRIESDNTIEEIELIHISTGKIYKLVKVIQNNLDLDLEPFDPGAYMMKIITSTGKMKILKVILLD